MEWGEEEKSDLGRFVGIKTLCLGFRYFFIGSMTPELEMFGLLDIVVLI